MNGGLAMDTIRTCVEANSLIGFINIPSSMYGKKVEVTIREISEKKSTPIADKFAGIASNLGMTADDVRSERLKYGTAN